MNDNHSRSTGKVNFFSNKNEVGHPVSDEEYFSALEALIEERANAVQKPTPEKRPLPHRPMPDEIPTTNPLAYDIPAPKRPTAAVRPVPPRPSGTVVVHKASEPFPTPPIRLDEIPTTNPLAYIKPVPQVPGQTTVTRINEAAFPHSTRPVIDDIPTTDPMADIPAPKIPSRPQPVRPSYERPVRPRTVTADTAALPSMKPRAYTIPPVQTRPTVPQRPAPSYLSSSQPRVTRTPERPASYPSAATRAYIRDPALHTPGTEHLEQQKTLHETDTENRLENSRKFKKSFTITSAVCVIATAVLYTYIAFFSTGLLGNLRDLYVETAIMTFSHSWLATCMFPTSVVDVTRDNISSFEQEQQGLVSDWSIVKEQGQDIVIKGHTEGNDETPDESDTETSDIPAELAYWEDPDSSFYRLFDEIEPDTLMEYIRANPDECFDENGKIFIDKADIGEDPTGIMTREGDPVIAVDERDGILLACVTGGSFLSGDNYRGVLAFIKDPTAVTLAASSRFGSVGQKIGKIAGDNGAILGINASGFADDEGKGNGGTVHGLVVTEGKTRSRASGGTYFTIYFDSEHHLNVSAYYKGLDILNGVEFKPAIIVNGENKIAKERFGIQPRTAIAQKADETVMMLVVDGRQTSYSLGTTVTELEVIFERYNALQAACLDGGSSSVMYFNGRLVTSSSSPQEGGRYLPDAFLVLPRSGDPEKTE